MGKQSCHLLGAERAQSTKSCNSEIATQWLGFRIWIGADNWETMATRWLSNSEIATQWLGFRIRADNGNLVFYITKYLPIKSSASQMIVEPR